PRFQPHPGATARHFLSLLAVLGSTLGFSAAFGGLAAYPAVLALGGGAAACFGLARWLSRPLRAAAREARAVFDNPLMALIYTGRDDEVGQVRLAQLVLQAKVRTVVGRIDEAAGELGGLAQATVANVEQTTQSVRRQKSETEQVATAMNEMAATVQEVARNTAQTAEAAQHADREGDSGKRVVTATMDSIDLLARDVEQAADVVEKLNGDSEAIGSVVDVIHAIAEQTNLLALNAAIEAARAGQHGRGFAVVAEEVRTLAQRTQTSTQEIQSMIERVQGGSGDAARVMKQSRERADSAVGQAREAQQALQAIHTAVTSITDMTSQIASAAEEQSAVAEEINRNLVNISQVADETAEGAEHTQATSEALAGMVNRFESLIQQARL
ncbi:MAG TPA: methyl-accepting chemotaxis protein, partial [Gammaproteobacteria bacterium]|nr:methyl-accepting chemotaxis protein [Gammaproteobacteria bacterium]